MKTIRSVIGSAAQTHIHPMSLGSSYLLQEILIMIMEKANFEVFLATIGFLIRSEPIPVSPLILKKVISAYTVEIEHMGSLYVVLRNNLATLSNSI